MDRLWGWLKDLPDKLTNREVAFIGDPETRRRVKEKRETAEYAMLRKYVVDEDLWAVVASGLALRDLEADPLLVSRLEALRRAIHQVHGTVGVRLAEVVQRGMLTDMITHWTKQGATDEDIRANIGMILSDLMAHIEFIQTGEDARTAFLRLNMKAALRSPQIVMARGHAGDALRRIARKFVESPSFHCVYDDSTNQSFLLVFKRDQWDEMTKSTAPDRTARPTRSSRSK